MVFSSNNSSNIGNCLPPIVHQLSVRLVHRVTDAKRVFLTNIRKLYLATLIARIHGLISVLEFVLLQRIFPCELPLTELTFEELLPRVGGLRVVQQVVFSEYKKRFLEDA